MKRMMLWIILCVAVFAVGIVGSILVLTPRQGAVVEIVQDGTVLHELDLSESSGQIIEVDYNGRRNTIEIDGDGIRVIHADCPDQNCVYMGYLGENGLPIVCLPNHLVIQYQIRNAGSDVDVVAR